VRCICASRMTTCHPHMFNLESGHSAQGFYTTGRDAAAASTWNVKLDGATTTAPDPTTVESLRSWFREQPER
jgi:hypothetical protein